MSKKIMPELSLIHKKEKFKLPKPAFVSLLPMILILGLVYGALYYYRTKLDEENTRIINSINELKAERKIEKEKEIKVFDKQLSALEDVFKNINYSSKFFERLESVILPSVSLKNLNIDFNKNSATLKGYTRNYSLLAQQVAVFLTSADIISEELVDLNTDNEGFINFEFKLDFKPDMFK